MAENPRRRVSTATASSVGGSTARRRRASATRRASTTSSGSAGADGGDWIRLHPLEGDGLVMYLLPHVLKMQADLNAKQVTQEALAEPSPHSPSPTASPPSGSPVRDHAHAPKVPHPPESEHGDDPSGQGRPRSFRGASLGVILQSRASKAIGVTADGGAPSSAAPTVVGGASTAVGSATSRSSHYQPTTATPAAAVMAPARPLPPMPDTVIYDRNFPQGWFRFDLREGEVQQRPGRMLDARKIFDGFKSVAPGSGGICAQFVSVVFDELAEQRQLNVMYLCADELEALVFGRDEYANLTKSGLLQKFVAPRAEHNDTMEVTWSPRGTYHERLTNRAPMSRRRTGPEVRAKAATFDGPPHLSEVTPTTDSLRDRVTEQLASLASRLLRREHKVVTRMVAHFKQDRQGRMWLLHVTSIRVDNISAIATLPRAKVPVEMSNAFNFTELLREASHSDDPYVMDQLARKCDYDPFAINEASVSGAARDDIGDGGALGSGTAAMASFRQSKRARRKKLAATNSAANTWSSLVSTGRHDSAPKLSIAQVARHRAKSPSSLTAAFGVTSSFTTFASGQYGAMASSDPVAALGELPEAPTLKLLDTFVTDVLYRAYGHRMAVDVGANAAPAVASPTQRGTGTSATEPAAPTKDDRAIGAFHVVLPWACREVLGPAREKCLCEDFLELKRVAELEGRSGDGAAVEYRGAPVTATLPVATAMRQGFLRESASTIAGGRYARRIQTPLAVVASRARRLVAQVRSELEFPVPRAAEGDGPEEAVVQPLPVAATPPNFSPGSTALSSASLSVTPVNAPLAP